MVVWTAAVGSKFVGGETVLVVDKYGATGRRYVNRVTVGISHTMEQSVQSYMLYIYSGTSEQRTLWGQYKFSCFVPYREVDLSLEVLNVWKL